MPVCYYLDGWPIWCSPDHNRICKCTACEDLWRYFKNVMRFRDSREFTMQTGMSNTFSCIHWIMLSSYDDLLKVIEKSEEFDRLAGPKDERPLPRTKTYLVPKGEVPIPSETEIRVFNGF